MAKYVIYNRESNTMQIAAERPQNYLSESVPFSGQSLIVWYAPDEKSEFDQIKSLIRIRSNPLLKDVELVCNQLIEKYPGSGFLSLGASPKLVKWRMKQKGAIVKAINVSGIKLDHSPPPAFITYLTAKLPTIPRNKPIVVFDFTDSGIGLYKIKRILKDIVPDVEIKTVAIGHSHQLLKKEHEKYKFDLDHIFKETIPILSDSLEAQATKGDLGRAKPKNPFNAWSTDNRGAHETAEQYRRSKADHRAAFSAGTFVFSKADVEAVLKTMVGSGSSDENNADDNEEVSLEGWDALEITAAPSTIDGEDDGFY